MKGEVKAEKGNRYVMTFGDRTIISNSQVLWNYSQSANNVLVSKFETLDSDVSLESFFFDFLDKYKPEKFEKSLNSEFGSDYALSLIPDGDAAQVMNINQAILYFNKDNYIINRIRLITSGSIEDWILTNTQLNPKFEKGIFQFTPPEDAEVIDLRN